MNYPKVSIVILNWNGILDTLECLESLQKITYLDYDVIVVDNGSEGDDVSILRDKFPTQVTVVENDHNYGFAEGSNIGMRCALNASRPAYLLLLNNDTVAEPGFLDKLVSVAESDPDIGILGPRILYHDFEGRNDVVWFTGGEIRWWHPKIWRFLKLADGDMKENRTPIRVDWVSGAAMMIRASVIDRISFLDSRYFFGHEDIDYCLRAQRHHFKIVYVPTSVVWHKVGRSRGRFAPGFADLALEYQLIKRNASTPLYVYHLLLVPLLLLKWGIGFLVKYRNRETLGRFLSNLKRTIPRGTSKTVS